MERDLWSEMERRFNKLFRGLSNDFSDENFSDYRRAYSDFDEDENFFKIKIELPGIPKEDIEIDVDENNLIVKAENKSEKKDKDSFRSSKIGFYQSISLPRNADLDNLKAKYDNGLLLVIVPKKKLSGKRIKIE